MRVFQIILVFHASYDSAYAIDCQYDFSLHILHSDMEVVPVEVTNDAFATVRQIAVEVINEKPALSSEYLEALRKFGFARYHKGVELVKKY